MNFHILHVSLFFNAYVVLKYAVLMFFSLLFIMLLLILCNFVTFCLAGLHSTIQLFPWWIPHSIQHVRMMDLCCTLYVCVCVCVCVYVWGETSLLISDNHNYYVYDNHCNRCQRNTSQCQLPEQFIGQQEKPLVQICYCGKYFIFYLLYDWEVSVCLTSGLTGLSECSCQRDVSNITLELSENHSDTCSNSVTGTWRLVNI